MRYDWLAIAGETLKGRYLLSSFEAEAGGVGRYVSGSHTIDILPVAAADSSEIAARWQLLRSVAHPNILSVVDTGTANLAGVDVIYCIHERSEDTVASVLPERNLTLEETDQIVGAVLPALRHLQTRGAVYSKLSATDIGAIGDEVKLALDPIQPVGDRLPRQWERADLERVLEGQVVAGVSDKPAAPAVAPVPPAPAPAGQPSKDAAPPVPNTRPSRPSPVPPPAPASVTPAEPRAMPHPMRPAPPAVPVTLSTVRKVALAAAALVVLVILYQLFKSRDPEPPAVADATRSSPVAPAPSPESQKSVAPPPAGRRVSGWTVVVGAYGREQDANKRAAALSGKWNRGPIQVVRSRGRYLLIAASGLDSKAEADRIRREARSAGLSRSAYVTRL